MLTCIDALSDFDYTDVAFTEDGAFISYSRTIASYIIHGRESAPRSKQASVALLALG